MGASSFINYAFAFHSPYESQNLLGDLISDTSGKAPQETFGSFRLPRETHQPHRHYLGGRYALTYLHSMGIGEPHRVAGFKISVTF